MKTISFAVSDKEYDEIKKIKDSSWRIFLVSGVTTCPYCGNMFSITTGQTLSYQLSHGGAKQDSNFGDWPYIRNRKKQETYDIDIVAIKKEE